MERAFVFRVGVYLQKLINDCDLFADLNLDSEYNKNLGEVKRTANYPKGIIPDLLIHERDSHNRNKLAVEFKGWWDPELADIQKLKDIQNPGPALRPRRR